MQVRVSAALILAAVSSFTVMQFHMSDIPMQCPLLTVTTDLQRHEEQAEIIRPLHDVP